MQELLSWGRQNPTFFQDDQLFNSNQPSLLTDTLSNLKLELLALRDQSQQLRKQLSLKNERCQLLQKSCQELRVKLSLSQTREQKGSAQRVKQLQQRWVKCQKERKQLKLQNERILLRLAGESQLQRENHIRCLQDIIQQSQLKIKNLQYQLDIKNQITVAMYASVESKENLKVRQPLNYKPKSPNQGQCKAKSKSPGGWIKRLQSEKGWLRQWK